MTLDHNNILTRNILRGNFGTARTIVTVTYAFIKIVMLQNAYFEQINTNNKLLRAWSSVIIFVFIFSKWLFFRGRLVRMAQLWRSTCHKTHLVHVQLQFQQAWRIQWFGQWRHICWRVKYVKWHLFILVVEMYTHLDYNDTWDSILMVELHSKTS